jgi:DNA repair protein RecN (Recombination protein N)
LKAGAVSDHSSLEEITIRGLGVIESASIELGSGLTVLTGETGAGKTMVLTALSLILGAKSDSDLVRHGEERATVSGRFHLNPELAATLEDDGAVVEDSSVIITRTVSSQGKSRIILGGAPSTTTFVAELASSLVEIHAQSSTARLTKPAVARELLDEYAENAAILSSYQITFNAYVELSHRIRELKIRLNQRDREVAQLSQFISDFTAVDPVSGEIDIIDNEISKLGSVELLHVEVSKSLVLLEDEDQSVFNLMQEIRKALDLTKGKDAGLDAITERYLDLLFNLQDVAGDLASYVTNLEADPVRFEFLQQRKAAINTLIKKYGTGNEKLAAFDRILTEAASAQLRLADLSGGDQRLVELERELGSLFGDLKQKAHLLSASRTTAAAEFSNQVTGELVFLSMPHSRLIVEVIPSSSEEFNDYSQFGIDEVRILFSSHAGGTPLALSKVASGGEMSRVMLALEVVLAATSPVGTYIFDEVDAGVGGKAAIEVGRRLAKLSNSAQVIVVTHLAQVAVWADHHLVVRKNEDGVVTQSDVIEVFGRDREVEIARMLSGQEESATAREHAAELLILVNDSMIS